MLANMLREIARYSIPGIFAVSFIGNAIPYSAIPYLAFIAAYSAASPSLSKIEIALAGGTGATAGKLLLYLIARYAGKRLSEKRRKELSSFNRLFQRKGLDFILIYAFAALPLPDDVLYFPLGFARYSMSKFFVAVLAGKVTLTGITALWGAQVGWLITSGSGILPLPALIAVLLLVTIYTLMIIFYTDWTGIVNTLTTKGSWEALKHLMREICCILLLRHEKVRKKSRALLGGSRK